LKLKILKKLRTANLNSEFTGSYKKKCNTSSEKFRVDIWHIILPVKNLGDTSPRDLRPWIVQLIIREFCKSNKINKFNLHSYKRIHPSDGRDANTAIIKLMKEYCNIKANSNSITINHIAIKIKQYETILA